MLVLCWVVQHAHVQPFPTGANPDIRSMMGWLILGATPLIVSDSCRHQSKISTPFCLEPTRFVVTKNIPLVHRSRSLSNTRNALHKKLCTPPLPLRLKPETKAFGSKNLARETFYAPFTPRTVLNRTPPNLRNPEVSELNFLRLYVF